MIYFDCSCRKLKILDNVDMTFQAIISPPFQFHLWGSAQLGLLKGMTARQLAMLPLLLKFAFDKIFSNFSRFGLETEWFNCSATLACWTSPILVSPTRTEPTQVILFAKLLFDHSPGKPCSFPDSTNRTGCHLYGTLTPACYTRFPLPHKPDLFISGTLTTVQSTILTETLTSGVTAGLAVASRLSDFLNLKTLNDDTKILTETDTETFFPKPIFPKPKPRLFFPRPSSPKPKPILFFRDQILWNRYRNPPKIGKSFEAETERNRDWTKPRLLYILDNFWRDLLQIFSSFSFSVFLLLQKKRYSPSPNILHLFLLCLSSLPE